MCKREKAIPPNNEPKEKIKAYFLGMKKTRGK